MVSYIALFIAAVCFYGNLKCEKCLAGLLGWILLGLTIGMGALRAFEFSGLQKLELPNYWVFLVWLVLASAWLGAMFNKNRKPA